MITWIQAQFLHLKALLNPVSLSENSAEARSLERYRRIFLTLVTSVGARGLLILTTLISIPLTIKYLGQEQYGLWVTISSTVALFTFADLGIGNGLLNAIAEANGRNDRELAQEHISSTFFLLTAIASFLGIIFAVVYSHIPWSRLYNVTSPDAIAEAGPVTAIFVGCFLLSMPLGVVQRVQIGYQEGFIDNLWVALGKIISLIGVVIAIALQGHLSVLVLALVGGPVLALMLNSLFLFGIKRPWLRPEISKITKESIQRVSHLGFLFFVLQIVGAIAYSSNSLILAQVLGPTAVAQYAVAAQLFSFTPLILNTILNPLWPAYGEALARGDHLWIQKTFRRSIKIGLLVNVLPSIFLLIFGQLTINLWTGVSIVAEPLLLLSLAIWTILNSFNTPIAMLVNGVNLIRFLAVCGTFMAISNLILSIFLTERIGLSGVVWGSIISQSLMVILPSLIYIPRVLRSKLQSKTS